MAPGQSLFFKTLDVEAAERVPGPWACGSDAPGHVALDGKRLRGSAPADRNGSKGVHLVSAFAGRPGAGIGRMRVSPEATRRLAPAVPSGLPLKGAVVTGDAAFCQRALYEAVRDGDGDYSFAVKANRPGSVSDIAASFGNAPPPLS